MRREELVKLIKRSSFTAVSTLEPDRALDFYTAKLSHLWDTTIVVYPSVSEDGLIYKVKEIVRTEQGLLTANEDENNEYPTPEEVAVAIRNFIEQIAKENEEQEYAEAVGILFFQSEKDEFLTSSAGMHLLDYILYDANRDKVDISFAVIGKKPKVSADYEQYFRFVSEDLPSKEHLEKIAREILGDYFESEEDIKRAVKYGVGLTEEQFISALKTSAEEKQTEDGVITFINPDKVKQAKEELINRSEVLKVFHPREVDRLIGFEGAKEFVKRLLDNKNIIEVKGIFLLGVPGIGKSLFAKNLAKETDVPTIMFNPARVFSSFVGESERRMEEALKIIDEIGEAIVYIDEIDKAIAGMGAGGRGDSGVSERVFGMFLSWLQDKNSDTFVIATANRVSHLPTEFLRAGRWNAIYFADYYPKEQHYRQLLQYYIDKFSQKGYQFPEGFIDDEAITLLKERKFTGAEVKELVQRAIIFRTPTIGEALQHITTAYETNPKALEALRDEASFVNAISVYDNTPVKPPVKKAVKEEIKQTRTRNIKL